MDLQRHPLPEAIVSIADLRVFVEHHVFVVWDFMLLLKALQQLLAPSGVPWVPPRHPRSAGLINTLVSEEECDCLPEALGGPLHLSHFGIYRRAMEEIGADTTAIDAVLQQAMAGDLNGAAQHPQIPPAAARFLATTQVLLREGEGHALAAAFAYGRELLVPDLFRSLLQRLQALALPCPTLCWYLERHVTLDGDSHGPLAEAMVLALVGDDAMAMQRVEQVKRRVIADRNRFWDALHAELHQPVPV
ncbi:MAG: DUF3050 domain-containing protein [Cyanobacteriota bacterium]|nr:DUF3050 domain-containing protein [Cyanobacteriota bacterium]